MALALTVTDRWQDGKRTHVVGTIAASGSYSTGGDTLDLTAAAKSKLTPVVALIYGIAGYMYTFIPGATLATGKMMVRTPGGSITIPHASLAHAHDLKITGGQSSGDALQVLATVVGKTAATNVTAAGGTNNIQSGEPAADVVVVGAAAQLGATSYPGGVTGDTITFHGIFHKAR